MFSIKLKNWYALAPNLESQSDWVSWAQSSNQLLHADPLPKTAHVPMMQGRRMSAACRLACEAMLALLEHSAIEVDAAIFISQHGELERSHKVIEDAVREQALSPTDFTMSVHNTAAGLAMILKKLTIQASSIAAGADSFQQALFEMQGLFTEGAKNILLIDFDGKIPQVYQSDELLDIPPYACAFIFEASNQLHCAPLPKAEGPSSKQLPQSLQFLKAILMEQPSFIVSGANTKWQWTRT